MRKICRVLASRTRSDERALRFAILALVLSVFAAAVCTQRRLARITMLGDEAKIRNTAESERIDLGGVEGEISDIEFVVGHDVYFSCASADRRWLFPVIGSQTATEGSAKNAARNN